MKEYTFTSESVSEGHPDKVCDLISDSIVDLFLSKDPESRVAAETMVTTNKVIISGEVNGPDVFKETPLEELVRNTIKKLVMNKRVLIGKLYQLKIIFINNQKILQLV